VPEYRYRCNQCRDEFDFQQKITDDPAKECGLCGGELVRLIQPVGIAFKGSGFYVNDYGKKERKAPASD
jgi:putative FmdB family regulatory protein